MKENTVLSIPDEKGEQLSVTESVKSLEGPDTYITLEGSVVTLCNANDGEDHLLTYIHAEKAYGLLGEY